MPDTQLVRINDRTYREVGIDGEGTEWEKGPHSLSIRLAQIRVAFSLRSEGKPGNEPGNPGDDDSQRMSQSSAWTISGIGHLECDDTLGIIWSDGTFGDDKDSVSVSLEPDHAAAEGVLGHFDHSNSELPLPTDPLALRPYLVLPVQAQVLDELRQQFLDGGLNELQISVKTGVFLHGHEKYTFYRRAHFYIESGSANVATLTGFTGSRRLGIGLGQDVDADRGDHTHQEPRNISGLRAIDIVLAALVFLALLT